MSMTRYRAAPPRANISGASLRQKTKNAAARSPGSGIETLRMGLAHAASKAWRRPTLPQLKLEYHRRCPVSRPSSGWDRVGHGRYGHQAMVTARTRILEIVHFSLGI